VEECCAEIQPNLYFALTYTYPPSENRGMGKKGEKGKLKEIRWNASMRKNTRGKVKRGKIVFIPARTTRKKKGKGDKCAAIYGGGKKTPKNLLFSFRAQEKKSDSGSAVWKKKAAAPPFPFLLL